MKSSAEFKRLLSICHDLSVQYPNDIIFIGGVAVYLHSIHLPEVEELAETTHDADFYISISAMGDLRDDEEVVANARFSKHQITRGGFEFDIYTERHSKLLIPYGDVSSKAISYESIRAACLEHLLALKIEAFGNRRASAKGMKDAKDVVRIALCAAQMGFHLKNYAPYAMDSHKKYLEEIVKGSAVVELAAGNSHLAKSYRHIANDLLDKIKRI